MTGIGYKQNTSLTSRPTSMISVDSVDSEVFTVQPGNEDETPMAGNDQEQETPMVEHAPTGSFEDGANDQVFQDAIEHGGDLASASVALQVGTDRIMKYCSLIG